MKRIKWLVLVVVALLAITALVGCGKTENKEEGKDAGAKLSGSVQIAGSTSVQPLSQELATAFMEKNPDVRVDVAGGGSSAGVKAAQDGTANIGASSRELKPEEKGLKEFVIAKDGIAVVVHSSNKIANLTQEQVKKIFTSEIKNWKEVGGADTSITVVTREEGSGTRGAFEELVLGKDVKFAEKAIVQNSTGAVRTAVASDANAIGYVSIGALNNTVKAVKIDGVAANEENVSNGTYKISRPFLYLTKEEPTGVVKAFIDWVLSDEGQKIVGEEFIPVK